MKKVILSLIVIFSMSVFSANAQAKIQSIDLGLKKVMPTIGNCMDGGAFCASSNDKPIDFTKSMVGISKVNENTVALTFSISYYNENRSMLSGGLILEEPTTIQLELAQKIGFNRALTTTNGSYTLRKSDKGYVVDINVK